MTGHLLCARHHSENLRHLDTVLEGGPLVSILYRRTPSPRENKQLTQQSTWAGRECNKEGLSLVSESEDSLRSICRMRGSQLSQEELETKSILSGEDSKCKGPGAGLMTDNEGRAQSDKHSTQWEEVCRSRLEE